MDATADLDRRVRELCGTVPLGMSRFQVGRMVLAKDGDARSYRQAVLELRKRHEALKKAEFRRRRLSAEEALLREQIAAETNPHRRLILEIDLEEKLFDAASEDALIADALDEVGTLLAAVEALPAYGRESFEAEEEGYWARHLLLQARREVVASGRVSAGTLESLERLGMPPEQVALEVQARVKGNVEALSAPVSPGELPPEA